MEYKITKLQNDKGLDIDIVNIINSNNYSFSFYTYGGYMLSLIHISEPTRPY